MELFQGVELKADDDGRLSETHTGAMIALRPRQDHIDRLAIVDGEPPEELHTTILFLGKADDYTYDTRARIIYAMREVAQRFRFVTGKGFGVNIWNPDEEDPCIVLGVGGSELVDIRNAIVEKLQGFDLLRVPEQHEPWQPHVTLVYTDDFSKAPELVGLAGEIVYDAIRIAFGGIVDDIPLQATESGNDGYAGGNRYAAVPLTVVKSFRSDLRVNDLFGHRTFQTKRVPVMGGVVLDEKIIRRVRTAAGVRRFNQPIGSVIVSDGKLSNLKTVESEYEGYDKYTRGGKAIYVHKNGGKYEALDASDNVIATHANQESLLKELDKGGGKKTSANRTSRAKPTQDKPGKPFGFKEEESEYEGYSKFIAGDGTVVYRDETDLKYYDENDKPVSAAKMHRLSKTAPVQTDKGKTVTRTEAANVMRGKPAGKDPVDRNSDSVREIFEDFDQDAPPGIKKAARPFIDDYQKGNIRTLDLVDALDNIIATTKNRRDADAVRQVVSSLWGELAPRGSKWEDSASSARRLEARLPKGPNPGNYKNSPTEIRSAIPGKIDFMEVDPGMKREYAALDRYTGEDYEDFNIGLRTGKLSSAAKKWQADLDSAFAKSKTTAPIQVLRGIRNVTEKLGAGNLVGKTFTDKAYASSTPDPQIAANFAQMRNNTDGAILVIRVPKGTGAVSLGGREAEVLLDRGLTFRIIEDRPAKKTSSRSWRADPKNLRQIVVEVVPSGEK